ncbi:MAG: hypothetical protein Q9210_005881, partial [Variospora velana]
MDHPRSIVWNNRPGSITPPPAASKIPSSPIPYGDGAIETQKQSPEPSAPLASSIPETTFCHKTTRSPRGTRPPPSSVSILQTTRKRVPWRGKTCIILLPPQPSKRELEEYRYLTQRDNEARLEKWRAQGYDTAGFELCQEFEGTFHSISTSRAQTRSSFPDPEDIRSDREQRLFRVNIPIRAPWESYVESVREAKLRALGVSLGDTSTAAQKMPLSHSLSHQSSSHGPSPPVSPSLTVPHSTDILCIYGGAIQARDLPAASSRISPATNMRAQASADTNVRHFPRHAIAQSQKPSEVPMPLLGPQSYFPTLRQMLPEDYWNSQSGSRIASNIPEGTLPIPGGTSAPENPSIRDDMHPLDVGYTTCHLEWPSQNGSYEDIVNGSCKEQVHESIPYPASMNIQHSQDEQDPHTSRSTNHLHTAVPHEHSGGSFETLERHLREAEESNSTTRPRLLEEDSQGRAQSRNSISASSIDHVGARISASKAPSEASSDDSPNIPQKQTESKCISSSLNALAPEFRSGFAVFPFTSPTADTRMLATAPAFTPAAAVRLPPGPREFSFSFSGPSFGHNTINATRDLPGGERSEGEREGMFSAVQYPHIPKPVRKSKAVPILRPRDERRIFGQEIEVQEDESGRITQAKGRQKRVRHSRRDVGHYFFSEASAQEPSSPSERQDTTNAYKIMLKGEGDHASLNSMSLEMAAQAADQLEEIIDDLSASEGFSSRNPDAGSAHLQQGVVTPTAASEEVNSDATAPCSLSVTHASHAGGSADEEFSTCGSQCQQVIDSPASSLAGHVSNLQKTQALANSSTSESLQRKDLSTTHCDPYYLSSGSLKEHTQAEPLHVSSAGKGRNNDLQTRDTFKGIPVGVSYIEPSYEEYNEVNNHLNEERSIAAAHSNGSPRPARDTNGISALDSQSEIHTWETTNSISLPNDAQTGGCSYEGAIIHQRLPSAESESADSSIVRMIAEDGRFSPSYRPSYGSNVDLSALRASGSAASAAISERDNGSLSSGEVRVHDRRSFFDAHVNDVVGNVLQTHLAPLEQSLAQIRNDLNDMSKPSSRGANCSRALGNADTSDADDEEDLETIRLRTKSPIRLPNTDKLKALITQIVTAQQTTISVDQYASITEDLKALKTLFEETRPSFADVKTVVEEATAKQMRGRSAPIASSHQSATVERNQLQIAGLESMLKVAEGRAEDELKARRATEDALADSQRLLRLALQDAAEQRESAEETERSLSAFYEERHEALRRNAILEGAQKSLQSTVSELAEKNAALEGTLEEYRLSSARWRNEIEDTKMENGNLRRTINALKKEVEDGIRNRHALRTRFDQLQEEMAQVSQNVLHDQSVWRTKEEELKAECRSHATDHERERKRCDQLENQIEALSDNVRCEREKQYQVVAQYEREIHNQREMASLERNRMRSKIDDDSTAAANKLNTTRSDLQDAVAKLQLQLEQANIAASTDKEKYQTCLQEAIVSKTIILQQHQDFHDWAVKGLKEQHEQVSRNAARERQTLESQSRARLTLADEKLLHYEDKIRHLEDKVEIARSAAQAAAFTAHSQQSAPGVVNQHGSSSLGCLPQKISPRALRESILVLQEQLQERESQIEDFEQKLSAVDTDAPMKMKAQATEITWLRELLGVRVDDLEDLINSLAQPTYDREAIKGAAIRLKASLQMEQQEKERAYSREQPSATFPNLSSLTSSPRALPLAAAAALGSWRKGWNLPVSDTFHFAHGHSTDTPSRTSPSAQSDLSGLLTPPGTDAQPSTGWRSATTVQRQNAFSPKTLPQRRQTSALATPSLTHKDGYDMDAVTANVEDIHETVETQERDTYEAGEEELL